MTHVREIKNFPR